MLLRKELHWNFGSGAIGFLKVRTRSDTFSSLVSNRRFQTPNFAMLPADVPQVVESPIPDNRTTLQYIIPPEGDDIVPQRDARVDWSHEEVQPPPSILLDFMYGAAVSKRWGSSRLRVVLEEYLKAVFSPVQAKKPFPPSRPSPPPEEDESGIEDDPNDPDWQPSSGEEARETFTSTASADLMKTMDHMLLLPMLLKGILPQSVAAEWERQNKEVELRSQEHSSEKVRQWLDAVSAIIEYPFPD